MKDYKKVSVRGGFSDRNKIKPLNTIIQYEFLDEHTRNAIAILVKRAIERMVYFIGYSDRYKLAELLLTRLFNEPVPYGTYPDLDEVSNEINKIFQASDFDEVLTIFESIFQLVQEYEDEYIKERNAHHSFDYYAYGQENNFSWFDLANELLEEEFVGYKFVDGQICKITSQTEIDSIMESINTPYSKVNEHIKNAISLIKENGKHDYKNSIKESVLALECLLNIVLNTNGLELGKALNEYLKKTSIHPALKESLSKLYGFASDSCGIRHDTNKKDNNEGFNEAKLILVNTSGFINYIISTKIDD